MTKQIRRFYRDCDATTAVEFGLVGALFLGMLLFTVELGFYLYAQLSLDFATAYAARQMLTGNGRTQGLNAATFDSSILCKSLQVLLSCSNITVNIMPVTDYATVPAATSLLTNGVANPPLLPDGTPNPNAPQFNVGVNSSLMVLQVIYIPPSFAWPLFYNNGQAVPIVSTAAYVNET